MTIAAPFVSRVMEIEKDWIDYNGHLNMAYYNVLFDRCSDEAFEAMGLGPDYARDRKLTIYTAEVHVCYVQELHSADRSRSPSSCSTTTTSGCAPIRKSATPTAGWPRPPRSLSLHVDMAGPKVAPFPPTCWRRSRPCAPPTLPCPCPNAPAVRSAIRRKPA